MSRTFCPRLPCNLRRLAVLALVLTASPGLHADEIWLTNGNRLQGSYRQLDGGRAEIQLSFGTIVLPMARITRVVPAATLADEVAAMLAQLPANDAQSRYEIARWCRDQGDLTLARRLLEKTLAIDPDHAAARRDLGFQRAGGRWVSEEELHQLRGEVLFRGQWLSPGERDRILAEEAAAAMRQQGAELQQAQLELEALRLRLAMAQLQLAAPADTGLAPLPVYGAPYTVHLPYGYSFPYGHLPSRPATHPPRPSSPGPGESPAPAAPRSHRAGRLPYSPAPR